MEHRVRDTAGLMACLTMACFRRRMVAPPGMYNTGSCRGVVQALVYRTDDC